MRDYQAVFLLPCSRLGIVVDDEALLALECEERDRHAIQNRLRDAQLPRMKTLEGFDFTQAPHLPAAKIRELAEGGYIERGEPVVVVAGASGTGKSSVVFAGAVPLQLAWQTSHRCAPLC